MEGLDNIAQTPSVINLPQTDSVTYTWFLRNVFANFSVAGIYVCYGIAKCIKRNNKVKYNVPLFND